MRRLKPRKLISWIGANDLDAVRATSSGPIISTLKAEPFDSVTLLYSYPHADVKPFLSYLHEQVNIEVQSLSVTLSSPIDYGDIYKAVSQQLATFYSERADCSILLSPGTPAMQAVWVLLGKTKYPCRFYQSSVEQGVQEVEIPFELSAEYIPAVSSIANSRLTQLADTEAPIDAAFDDIITRNPRIKTLKAQAQILAERNVPVLIYGETGTGKELFARAIHNASNRADQPFVPLNCGAIPSELVDSVLFGHKKGAFTGASADKPGVFQQANGGTLFLDEFGELEPSVQVRLLRVLQEGVFTPVGSTREEKVDVRLVTATHRNLMEAVSEGAFREDLFYRVAVGVLHLPPLRAREGDLSLLAENLLAGLAETDESLKHKNLSPEAKNIILRHPWRGNVRELQSTLLRAALWSGSDTISAEDLHQALFQMPEKEPGAMVRDISQGVDIQELIGELVVDCIHQALAHTGQNKTRAAELLGLKNYQTLNNWMEKYGVK